MVATDLEASVVVMADIRSREHVPARLLPIPGWMASLSRHQFAGGSLAGKDWAPHSSTTSHAASQAKLSG